jgi:hypothetical protein
MIIGEPTRIDLDDLPEGIEVHVRIADLAKILLNVVSGFPKVPASTQPDDSQDQGNLSS